MARIPLPDRDSLSGDARQVWDRTAARGPVLNIQRALLSNPEIELPVLRTWKATHLEPRAREIVILRCARVKESTYEWHQHVRIGREAGLSDAEIKAVGNWRQSDLFAEDERALLAYVDAMATSPRPGDAEFEAVSRGRPPGDVFAITFLITQYFQLAHVMSAFDLETETPFVGWDLEGGQ